MQDNIFNQELRVAYYARVSTQFDSQLSSLDNQISHYENLIKNNPSWHFAGGYVDEGISGTSAKSRTNFLKMIDDANKNKFDLIITKEISRFSRNTLDSITYTRHLLKSGVGVYFENDSICTLSSDSELRLTIMSAIAQDEVRRISERIKFGFKESIAEGKVLGTGAMIGYTKKDGVLYIDEEKAEVVRLIFSLYADKKIGIRQISKELEKKGFLNSNGNPYTFSTIKNIITNPKYKGFYCGNKYENTDIRYGKKSKVPKEKWVMKEDENIPAIVSAKIWERANEILSSRNTNAKKCATKYAYSGKVYCGKDSASYQRNVFSGREVWQCANKRKFGEKICQSVPIYTEELNRILNLIWDIDEKYISDTLIKIYSSCKSAGENADNMSRIAKLKRNKSMLLQLLADEVITNDDCKAKLYEIDCKIDLLNNDKNNTNAINKDKILSEIESIFFNRNENLLTCILKSVTVNRDETGKINLDISLVDGRSFNASYFKKGSKILSQVIVNEIKPKGA